MAEQIKKPYATPSLSVYGNLTSLTSAVGSFGAMDNATMSPNMTRAS